MPEAVAVVPEEVLVLVVLEEPVLVVVQVVLVVQQVQVETAGLQMVVVQEIVLQHHPLIPLLVMHLL